MNKIKVGVLGATGAAGNASCRCWRGIRGLRSPRCLLRSAAQANAMSKPPAAGICAATCPRRCVPSLSRNASLGVDCQIVFSACRLRRRRARSRRTLLPRAYAVCSNARNHRYDADVPLLIPEVNPEHLALVDLQKRKRGGAATSRPIPIAAPRIWFRRCTRCMCALASKRSLLSPCRPSAARAIRA